MTNGAAAPLLALDLPARPGTVPLVRREVVAFLQRHSIGEPLLSDVALAASEAVTNAVKHAYDPGEDGLVHVVADLEGDDFQMVVRDDGHGVRPGSSSGLGQGLSIIATICSDFTVTPLAGGGLQVWMRFLL